jgi:hypothetical protein
VKEYVVEGQPPPAEHEFWRQAIQEIRKNSVKTVEDAARQLIGLVTLLSGLYFHAITFSQLPQGSVTNKVLFVGPLALWLLSLFTASLALFPVRFLVSPYEPEAVKRVIQRDLGWKYGLLFVTLVLLVISLGWLVVAAWVYLDIYVAG